MGGRCRSPGNHLSNNKDSSERLEARREAVAAEVETRREGDAMAKVPVTKITRAIDELEGRVRARAPQHLVWCDDEADMPARIAEMIAAGDETRLGVTPPCAEAGQ